MRYLNSCRVIVSVALSAVLVSFSAPNYAAYSSSLIQNVAHLEQIGYHHQTTQSLYQQAREALRQRDFEKVSRLIAEITHNDPHRNLQILGELLREQQQVNSAIRNVFDWYK